MIATIQAEIERRFQGSTINSYSFQRKMEEPKKSRFCDKLRDKVASENEKATGLTLELQTASTQSDTREGFLTTTHKRAKQTKEFRTELCSGIVTPAI